MKHLLVGGLVVGLASALVATGCSGDEKSKSGGGGAGGDASAAGGTSGAGGAGAGGTSGSAGTAGSGGTAGVGGSAGSGVAGAGGGAGASGAAGAAGQAGAAGSAGSVGGGPGDSGADGASGAAGDGGCVAADAPIPFACSTGFAGATVTYDAGSGEFTIVLPAGMPLVVRVDARLDINFVGGNFNCGSFGVDVVPASRTVVFTRSFASDPVADLWIRNLTVRDECGNIYALDPASGCVEPHLLFGADGGSITVECGNQPDPDCTWDCS